jgi:hypothetical protein
MMTAPFPHPRALLFGLLLSAAAPALAGSCQADSAPTRTPLVELYTSEGCNTCPPADRWLSRLTERSDLVALAFHVDYWDYIGWKDRFGDARNTARQREWARITGARTIYTPQVLVNGKDAFAWRTRDPLAGLTREPATAHIRLRATHGADGIQVQADARADDPAGLRLVVARYERGHVSEVLEGENHGATLRHDFVVRHWQAAALPSGAPLATQLAFPAPEHAGGIAAFVEDTRSGRVLQALALPDCDR